MKKGIIILSFAIVTLGLVAYGTINCNNEDVGQIETLDKEDVAINKQAKEKIEKRIFTDFIYEVGPRFGTIKKSDLMKARTIEDFIPEDQIQRIEILTSVSVIIFEDNKRSNILENNITRVNGITREFTEAQLEFLQSFDYSTNFLINAEYVQKNLNGTMENSASTPHLTIVPEKQAEYLFGIDALKYFLKEKSKDARTNVDPEKLKPAKLFFTVTKKGTIENIHLDRSSNYPDVDEVMIKLIKETPGTWNPAENAKGEKVDQELVVSFGLMGC